MYYGAKFVLTMFESWNRCSCPAELAYPLNLQTKSMTTKTSKFWDAQKNHYERKFFSCVIALGKGAVSASAAFSLCVALYIDLSCFGSSAQGLKNKYKEITPWQVWLHVACNRKLVP